MDTELITTGSTVDTIAYEINRDPRLKSVNTRRGYLADLGAFETWRGGRPMTRLLVEEYAAHLQGEGKSPHTINRVLAAIRWWARKVGDLAYEAPMDKTQREEVVTQTARIAGIRDVSGTRSEKGRSLTPGELAALMAACQKDTRPTGERDAAIIALAWATGARRSELAGLQLSDVVWTGEDEADVVIRGKGDRTRKVYVFDGAALALRGWLALRGHADGPLFYAINKSGDVQVGCGISDEALAQMLVKRAAQAGVSNITWHDFRRTFAGNLLSNGSDLVTVQKLMGHASPITTSNYDRRGEEVKRRALQSLHVPYRRR